jgi:steroid delta-isomerase-like uncharacterized protein
MRDTGATLVERGFALWNSHDAAGLADRFAEDAVMRVMPTAEAAGGREQIRELAEVRLRAFPDWHLEPQSIYDCGDAVCAEWELTGTHESTFMGIPPTQRRIELTGCSIFELDEEGYVTEERIYFDAATMLQQLGLLPDGTEGAGDD